MRDSGEVDRRSIILGVFMLLVPCIISLYKCKCLVTMTPSKLNQVESHVDLGSETYFSVSMFTCFMLLLLNTHPVIVVRFDCCYRGVCCIGNQSYIHCYVDAL